MCISLKDTNLIELVYWEATVECVLEIIKKTNQAQKLQERNEILYVTTKRQKRTMNWSARIRGSIRLNQIPLHERAVSIA